MQRDLNKICATCVYYCEGQCRIEPPRNIGPIKVELGLPEMSLLRDNQCYLIRPMGIISGALKVEKLWPSVGESFWCGRWSDGTCEFCGK